MATLRTLKARILLLLVAVLLGVALSLIVLARKEIETALYLREQDASKDVLFLVMRNIEGQYQSILYNYRALLEMRKEGMKNLVGVALQVAEHYDRRGRAGLTTDSEAQRAALDEITALRHGSDDYFFVYDERFVAIGHPDPLFAGKMLRDYRDAKGALVVQAMMAAAKTPDGGFVDYWWKRLKEREPAHKIGYAAFYPRWKWMIGTGLYVDDLEAEYQRKLDAVVTQLQDALAQINARGHGSLFLFNGKKELLIPPADAQNEISRLDEFIEAAAHPGLPFHYRAGAAGGQEAEMQAYVAHFPPLDWYVVGAFREADLRRPGQRLIAKAMGFVFIVLLFSLALGYLLAVRIARPISQLTGYTKELAARDFHPIADSAADRLAGRGDEVGELAEAFVFMQQTLQRHLEHLAETTAAKERIESELRVAREIQMSLLPKPLDGGGRFAISGSVEPAREVGGDFYDYFYTDDRHLALVVGDVCDKGVPASLFMAVTMALIRSFTIKGVSAAEVLEKINAQLARDNEQCMFVTIFLAVADLDTGEVQYSNAGHNPPLWLAPDGRLRAIEDGRAAPAGARKVARYRNERVQLASGDALVLYTDGATEAEKPGGAPFAEDRLRVCVLEESGESVEKCVAHIFRAVHDFRGPAPQTDDLTALVFRYLGSGEGKKHANQH